VSQVRFRLDQSCRLGVESSVSFMEDEEKEPVGVSIRSVNSANATMRRCVHSSVPVGNEILDWCPNGLTCSEKPQLK
jgi:hypothetical protein